jgi:hypothetical protein
MTKPKDELDEIIDDAFTKDWSTTEFPWAEDIEEARRSFVFAHLHDTYSDQSISNMLRDMERVVHWLRSGDAGDSEKVVGLKR